MHLDLCQTKLIDSTAAHNLASKNRVCLSGSTIWQHTLNSTTVLHEWQERWVAGTARC